MQGDCNLVLRESSNAIWSIGTAGRGSDCYAKMQSDGNLVIYNGQGAVWSTKTVRGFDTYELILQEDRNVVIYKGSERKAIWDTKTYYKLAEDAAADAEDRI
ncbi:Bulb-type lectin domain-containing protein [Heracleum sosnowskyi]|uniref:Bulb-type lectin domain-containing protein n=1 Tax=Heracleum sosnowskyi TaxID=360622 RepID=A0AAD8MX19_9APIA|nr:Bulb-type lectin domain-containing protein [Heracleum sosnowskyi]